MKILLNLLNYSKNIRQKGKDKILLNEKKVLELKKELKRIDEKCVTLFWEEKKIKSDEVTEKNSVCPKCQSKNVNDRIKRQQGKIKGDVEGSGWSLFTIGESHLSGNLRGEIDTYEVNKCNDCQHEWMKYKQTHFSRNDFVEIQIENVFRLLMKYHEAENCRFDALDLDEKYYSFEEKKKALTKIAKESYLNDSVKTVWDGTTLEAFNIFSKKYLTSWIYDYYQKYYNEELLLNFGFKKEQ